MSISAEQFWDTQYDDRSPEELPPSIQRSVEEAMVFFGNMRGKRVLDIGCGNGATTLSLAQAGAEVTGIDTSSVAVDKLNRYVAVHRIANVSAMCTSAMALEHLGEFDFVYGSLILHHIEPFSEFCSVLRNALKPGGRAFFFENSATSQLLIWFREHVVGRLWVPRCGDGIEFPLTPAEVDMLRKQFSVDVRIPEMVFFQLVSIYLLRRRLTSMTKAVDDLMFRWNIGKKYSYRQYLLING